MTVPSIRESTSFERPYPPGWFDRLIDLIDRLPAPNPVYFLGLLLLQLAYLTGLLWMNEKVPVGSIDLRRAFLVVVTPYLLWVRFYLDRVAGAALDDFRPALAVGDPEFLRLRYELTTLPARTTRIVTMVAVAAFAANFVLMPAAIVGEYAPSREAGLLEFGLIGISTIIVVAVSVAHALHQLQMVRHLHDRATTIHLFRAKPLYAFSGLTARTGMSFLLLTYYLAAVRPDLTFGSPALKAILVVMVLTSIACFVLPLLGMHRRIATEKDRALGEVASRFEAVTARLHERVDQGMLTDADKLNMQLSSLVTAREALARVSTWPWEATTLTGFVTTLILPALIWVVQRVLTRMGF